MQKELVMAIGSASEKGSFVYLYDEKGRQIGCLGLSGGRLAGFSSTSVGIEKGSFLYIYDDKGRHKTTIGLSGGRTIGFTSSSISIERGSFVYTYDEKGRQTGCRGK